MKNIKQLISLLLLMIGAVSLTSCQDEVMTTHTYRAMVPIFLEMSDIRAKTITVAPPQELDNPGKIYLYGDYLLINEPTKGIHILDNTNPANPVNKNFIPIEERGLGCQQQHPLRGQLCGSSGL
ncbi:hypothetical protein [Algoriphagus boritolerans]|uniref:hypothetical protein n=1 Tax=Algoriphagus boritolerans TaxID=308111 RepID=UPI002FCE49E9